MKIIQDRLKCLVRTAGMLSFVGIAGFGLPAREGHVVLIGDLISLIRTLPDSPCKIMTSLRTFPERMDPTCSECRQP
jgi:hypothetical protein